MLLVFISAACKERKDSNRPVGAGRLAVWIAQFRSPLSERFAGSSALGLFSYNSISVVSPSVVFVAADYPGNPKFEDRYGVVIKTVDGGSNWQEMPLTQPGTKMTVLNSLYFIDETTGWAAGIDAASQPAVVKTTDGGVSWSHFKLGVKQTPTSVYFSDANTGWIVGVTDIPGDESETGPSDIFSTTDGGVTWQPQMRIPVSLTDLTFVDEKTGWASGNRGAIYKTTDRGRTWTAQRSMFEPAAPVDAGEAFIVGGIHFVDTLNGWASVRRAEEIGGSVIRTIDGGKNWTISASAESEKPRDIFFVSKTEGWSTRGASPFIYHTTDGGNQWGVETIRFEQNPHVYRVAGTDAQHLWAVGGGAIFYRTLE